ncbi:Ribosomal protein L7Ae signature domain-containing protein [Forsythia ovata]|uniref:Ribosomal protein L7Ae signature domain-containing protein n=1 Tax=Forsythia ovata TaxID=205694 RepID=A0ABD1NY53_9LAMI
MARTLQLQLSKRNVLASPDTDGKLKIKGRCASSAGTAFFEAVLLASDCNPRWLTKHLPALAASRKVPLIFIKDNKEGSLRLGDLVKLKTAIAIGIQSFSVENTVSIRYCVLTNKTDEA